MKISTKAQYGLRAVAYLAQNQGDQKVISLREIAYKEGISFDYLEKIATQLEKAGIFKSKKGVSGGYMLARPANEITIGQLFAILEPQETRVKCLDANCPRQCACLTKNLWQKLQQNINEFLGSITVQDLIHNKLH